MLTTVVDYCPYYTFRTNKVRKYDKRRELFVWYQAENGGRSLVMCVALLVEVGAGIENQETESFLL